MDKEAVGMERERQAFEAWAKDHVDSLALGRNGGYAYADASRAWKAWQARAALAQQPAAQAWELADEDIDRIAESMPGGVHGFLKGWGWRNFARAVEGELLSRAAPSGKPVEDNEAYDRAYDKIDRFLRSNLGDNDYAEFSQALDSLAAPPPSAQQAEQPTAEAVTVWKDGRYKFWRTADAAYAQNDPDWLATIPLTQPPAKQADDDDEDAPQVLIEWGKFPGWLIDHIRALLAAPAAAEAPCRFCQAVEEHKVPAGLADVFRAGMRAEAAHSRQAQGGTLGLTDKQRTAIEHAIGLAGAARMHGTADVLQSILARAASEPRAEGLDVEAIAKAAWDEAWELAFSDGESAGHPLGRSRLNRDHEWDRSESRAVLAAQKKGA